MGADTEMEKFYFECLDRAGSRKADLARSMYAGFVLTDYTIYKEAEKAAGPAVARKVHKNAWLRYVPWVIKDAFEAFKIAVVKDIPTVGRIAKIMYDRISCPLIVKQDTSNRLVGIVLACPIVDFSMGLFEEKLGCPYHKSLAEALTAFNNELVNQLGLRDEIEVICDKFICQGDDFDRIIFQRKK